MRYALFPGCTAPARIPSYEASVRGIFQKLGVDLVYLDGQTCCSPIPMESIDFKTSAAIAAYNIGLAEEADLDLMTICSGCFQLLAKMNVTLREKGELRAEINEVLSEVGKEYRGSSEVVSYLQVLYKDLGVEKLRKYISKPLKGLRVGVFYGCHLLRPSSLLMFDNPEEPHILDDLVDLTGAESVKYAHRMRCCGGLLRGINDELSSRLVRDHFSSATQAKVDCIATVCPFCFIQLDIGQLDVRKRFNEQYNLPIVLYSELLGLAMGIDPRRLGLHTHRVPTNSVLEKIR